MAFSDDAVKAKLSALNETQDSIVTVAQWVMFYRRHADRAIQIWFDRLKESNTSKKLILIYLANEIMQQAKVRLKDDFLNAFMPFISEATALAYKGAPQEVQIKIRRVVEVWRQRGILEPSTQDATETRIDDLDKNRSSKATGGRLGGSLFGASSVPAEFQSISQAHATLSASETTAKPLIEKANKDYADQTSVDLQSLSAPVQAGKLSALMRSLASAEASVNDCIKARKALIDGLGKLLETHKSKLNTEETTFTEFSTHKAETEVKRKEVEEAIFQHVSAEDDQSRAQNQSNNHEDRPEVEGFTPPPPDVNDRRDDSNDADEENVPNNNDLDGDNIGNTFTSSTTPGADLMASLAILRDQSLSTSNGSGNDTDPPKKRKRTHAEADLDEQMFSTVGDIGLDADVAASLGAQ